MSDQKQQVHIRLHSSTVQRLSALAKQQRRSRSQQIEFIIEEYLAQAKKQR